MNYPPRQDKNQQKTREGIVSSYHWPYKFKRNE